MTIFISHSSHDDEFVSQLYLKLRGHNYDTWIDHFHLVAGTHWDKEVEDNLRQCSTMILVLSPKGVASDEVRAEWDFFKESGRAIIPVMIEECVIPLRLRLLHYIKFPQAVVTEDNLGQLLAALEKAHELQDAGLTGQFKTTPADTNELKLAQNRDQARQLIANQTNGSVGLNQLMFVFPELKTIAKFSLSREKLFIGWYDPVRRRRPDIDLSNFQAEQHGVSRQHALLTCSDIGLTLTDIGSTNGTFIGQTRLKLMIPYPLKDEDLIQFSTLTTQIYYRVGQSHHV
ncbi:MAG TPA: TIR domain-containing protein [Phototrophicaceae bacterium]|nr:TIR domain-containing protein [Phototrophicaceae bacterium]